MTESVPEAQLKQAELGLVVESDGWFVVNARDVRWVRSEARGQDTDFEGKQEFPELGFRIHVLEPGQRNGMYHGENHQEDFLVVSGECLLVIEGEERSLRAWDFVHCPPWTRHVFVGAGDAPCVIVMVGSRVVHAPSSQPHPTIHSPLGVVAARATTRATASCSV